MQNPTNVPGGTFLNSSRPNGSNVPGGTLVKVAGSDSARLQINSYETKERGQMCWATISWVPNVPGGTFERFARTLWTTLPLCSIINPSNCLFPIIIVGYNPLSSHRLTSADTSTNQKKEGLRVWDGNRRLPIDAGQ